MSVDVPTLTLIAAVFLLAGFIKGVIGLGLPTVSLGLLTAVIGLQPAMVLLIVPSFITNVWQALAGGHARAVLLRIWPFLLAAPATIWIGAGALTRVDHAYLSALLGFLLIAYALLGLFRPSVILPKAWEAWAGLTAGIVNGLLTGMTGSFVVPGVLYLQALGLSRDMLIQAMGMLFAASTLALSISLARQDLLSTSLSGLSMASVLPAMTGVIIGQRLRVRIPEPIFRRVFFVSLLLLGSILAGRSIV